MNCMIEKLNEFLVEQNCLEEFWENISKDENKHLLERFEFGSQTISGAFLWYYSKSGCSFWKSKDEIWRTRFYELGFTETEWFNLNELS